MSQIKCTIFKSITDTQAPYEVLVSEVLERIRKGQSKKIVDEIRGCMDKDKRNSLKMRLPCVCFSGIFSRRAESGLIKHSGLLVLDFDELSDAEEKLISDDLKSRDFVYAVWLSPSGNGLKALIKISDPLKHREHFASLKKEFAKIDESGKDVSRVCYESYDPNIYINTKSIPYTKYVEKQIWKQRVEEKKQVTEQDKIYENIKKWLEKDGCYFYEGNRNNFIMRLSAACNRFGITHDDCLSLIISDFLVSDGDFSRQEAEATIKSIYTKHTSTFGTAIFEDSKMVDKTTHVEIPKEVFDLAIEPKDIIYLNDVRTDLLKDFNHGTGKGETTYFPGIDNHYRFMRGEVTLMGGIGNYGKSSLLTQLLLIKSVKDGHKWTFFSPEQNPPIYFYKEIIRSYIGKPIDIWDDNRMSENEFKEGMDFVNEHFTFVYPKTSSPTPDYMMERFLEMVIKKKTDGVIIDPFNQLANDWGRNGRDDHYLDSVLTKFKRFALDNNVFFHVVAHPNKLMKEKDGNYPCPGVYDLAGGAMWNNKMDNILAYHRPNYQTNPQDSISEFHSQKIKKQMLNGKPGMIALDYHRASGRFFEAGFNPLTNKRSQPNALSPNLDFSEPLKNQEQSTITEYKEGTPF
jgi:twinkle protein